MNFEKSRKRTEKMTQEAKRLLLNGNGKMRSYEQLAKKYNFSITYVCRKCKEAGL